MAAASELLLTDCDFSSVSKHAQSFCKIITNANFRSLFVWCKKEILNKKDANYDGLLNLDQEAKTWIAQERAKHIRYFAVQVATDEPRSTIVRYEGKDWMIRFRKMLTESAGQLWKKSLAVREHFNLVPLKLLKSVAVR